MKATCVMETSSTIYCLICLLRAQWVTDYSDHFHPVNNFAQILDGEWTPTLDLMTHTAIYQGVHNSLSTETISSVPCLTLSLVEI